MEIAGLAVGVAGLAGLLGACIDAVDRVDTYRNFGFESRYITTRFADDKFLLHRWSEAVGITDGKLQDVHHRDLDRDDIVAAIANTLPSIHEICSEINSLSSNLQDLSLDGKSTFLIRPDNRTSDYPTEEKKPRSLPSRASKLKWSIGGKARLTTRIEAFGILIRKLYDIIPLEDKSIVRRLDKLDGFLEGLSKENSDWFNESQRGIQVLLDQLRVEKKKELHLWLDAVNTTDTYEKHLSARLESTCEWIFAKPEYVRWASSDFPFDAAKVLWVHGPAGYGKSVLCARLLHQLQSTNADSLAYFFCSHDTELHQNPLSMIRSWVSQLVSSSQDIFEMAQQQMRAKGESLASTADVWNLFDSIVHCGLDFTYVVDGLDECLRSDNNQNGGDCSRRAFLLKLKKSISQTRSRLLIVSRDEGDIRSGICLDAMTTLKLTTYECGISQTDVQSDVALMSKYVVDEKLYKKPETLRQGLATQMAQKSEGMFLWVKLQERSLRNSKNGVQLQKIVNDMPTGLTDVYKRDWERISNLPNREMYRALAILQWTVFAVRPLTILELTEALAIKDEDDCGDLLIDEIPDVVDDEYINDEILDLCGSLVEIRDTGPEKHLKDKTVGLVHPSVREFLLSRETISRSLFAPICENNSLAKICLRYLNYDSSWTPFETSCENLKQHPFLDYAAASWAMHIDSSGSDYGGLICLVNKLFTPQNSHWSNWRDRYETLENKIHQRPEPSQNNPGGLLYYAALFGLVDTLKFLQDQEVDNWNSVGGQYGTALGAASAAGHLPAISFLIDQSADVNVRCGLHGYAVNAAASSGNRQVILLLVNAGASLSSGDAVGWTPLHLAAGKGHTDTVKLLLDRGADFSVAHPHGVTPLHIAANYGGYLDLVELLLDKGADVSIADAYGWTPLNLAANRGYLEVVKLLLDRGADISVANNHGCTPLQSAVNRGYLEVVKLLLDRGVDISGASASGRIPLIAAVYRGHHEVVKLLLDRGADISVASPNGWTPLSAAAESGYLEVVKLLLDRGADTSVANRYRWTPLHSAANQGYLEVVKLLLDRGANISVASAITARTPLIAAINSGHLEVVKLLLDKGADISPASPDGWTPLIAAVSSGHLEIVKVLLDKGVDCNAGCEIYGNTLHIASHKGHVEIAEMLLPRIADISYKDRQGRTALHLACAGGNLIIIELLFNDRPGLTCTDKQGRNCLHYGASSGSACMTTWLLNQGLDPNLRDRDGWTSLHWAAKSGSVETLEILRNAGAISSTEYINRWTPQDIALFHHHGLLQVLTSNTHVETASGCSVLEQIAGHPASEGDLLAPGDQISPGTKHKGIWCDGCFLGIYGPRYKCLDCADFDYCFKCNASSDMTHAGHRFERRE